MVEKSVLKSEGSKAFSDVISFRRELEKLPKLCLVCWWARDTKKIADNQTFQQAFSKVVTSAKNVVVVEFGVVSDAIFVPPDGKSALKILPEEMGEFFVFDVFHKNENVKQVFGRAESELPWCEDLLFGANTLLVSLDWGVLIQEVPVLREQFFVEINPAFPGRVENLVFFEQVGCCC